ncbi:hypothetical protein Peur_061035 [Populus x canadensis]
MSSDFVFISSSLAILRARFVLRILLFCSTLIFSRSASLKFNSLIFFSASLALASRASVSCCCVSNSLESFSIDFSSSPARACAFPTSS